MTQSTTTPSGAYYGCGYDNDTKNTVNAIYMQSWNDAYGSQNFKPGPVDTSSAGNPLTNLFLCSKTLLSILLVIPIYKVPFFLLASMYTVY